MKRFVIAILGALGVLIVIAGTAQAQTQPTPAPAPRATEISAGYQYQRFEGGSNWGKGWFADVAHTVDGNVSVVGQVTGSYKSESTAFSGYSQSLSMSTYSFMGGVRISSRGAKGRAFAHVLGGAWRFGATQKFGAPTTSQTYDETENHFTVLGGAGFVVPLRGRLGLRAGGDYVRVLSGGWLLRAQAGLTWSLGAR